MEEPKSQDQTLNLFKAINGFVKNMNECYGTQQRTLQLYARLISKTTIEDEVPISRHIAAFAKFFSDNKDAILEKDHKKLSNVKISYNEKVYINMDMIFRAATTSERTIIWKHILTIYAFIDPQSRAKEMLREVIDKDGVGGAKEEEFLSDIFDKVGNNIQTDGNPLQAVGNLMSSGVFTDIVGSMSNGLESGELDLGKLMGSMQGMVTNIGQMAEQNGQPQQPEMTEMLNQMTAMMGNLNNMTNQSNVSQEDLTKGSELAHNMISTQRGGSMAPMMTTVTTTVVSGMPSEMPSEGIQDQEDVLASSKFEVIEDDPVEIKRPEPKRISPTKVTDQEPVILENTCNDNAKAKRKNRRKKKHAGDVPSAPDVD